jgi:hypothetical protein
MIRVPRTLDKCFRPRHRPFHGNHFEDFRLLVLVMAFAWGRHQVANLSRSLDAQHHRTRFNNFFLRERWDPEAARRQTAQALLRALRPGKGATVYLIIDDAQQANRGTVMDAIATMKDPTTAAYLRGHQ